MHEEPTAGHNNAKKMFQQIYEKYYWPNMFKDIRGYANTCDDCQRRKGLQQNNILHLIPAKASFQRIGIDIMGPLTITWQGN